MIHIDKNRLENSIVTSLLCTIAIMIWPVGMAITNTSMAMDGSIIRGSVVWGLFDCFVASIITFVGITLIAYFTLYNEYLAR